MAAMKTKIEAETTVPILHFGPVHFLFKICSFQAIVSEASPLPSARKTFFAKIVDENVDRVWALTYQAPYREAYPASSLSQNNCVSASRFPHLHPSPVGRVGSRLRTTMSCGQAAESALFVSASSDAVSAAHMSAAPLRCFFTSG